MTNETDAERYIDRVMKSLKSIEYFALCFFIGLVALIGMFAVALGVRANVAGEGGLKVFLLALGTSLIVFVAAAAVGGLLGFLFGIPRSLQGGTSSQAEVTEKNSQTAADVARNPVNVARAFMNNTSLEEISDWLTKIIIGLGLVQFQLLIDYLYRCAVFTAAFVASQSVASDEIAKMNYDPKLASPFFFALIVASLIASCLFSYLETRTRLMLLFVDAEGANTGRSEERRKAEEASERPLTEPLPVQAPSLGNKKPPPPPIAAAATEDDRVIAKVSLESFKNPKEVVGWAVAQARTGNLPEAERGLQEALQKNPDDDSIRERIVEVRRLNKDTLGAVRMMVEIAKRSSDLDKRYDLLRRALFEALYIDPPEGFTEALTISQMLLELTKAQTNPTVHYWRACALGQKYKALLDANIQPTAPEMKAIWDEALARVTKVVELAPDYEAMPRTYMRSVYEAVSSGENDLAVFKSGEFDAIIYLNKPEQG